MAICYLSDTMIRNKPELIKLVLKRVERMVQCGLGFGFFTLKFELDGYEENEPVLLRFYDKENKTHQPFEFVRKMNTYR